MEMFLNKVLWMVILSLSLSVLDAFLLELIRLFFSCDLRIEYEIVMKLVSFLMFIALFWWCLGWLFLVSF